MKNNKKTDIHWDIGRRAEVVHKTARIPKRLYVFYSWDFDDNQMKVLDFKIVISRHDCCVYFGNR